MALVPIKGQPGLFRDTDTGRVCNIRDFRESDKFDDIVIPPSESVPPGTELVFFHDSVAKQPGWSANIEHPTLGRCDFYNNNLVWEPTPDQWSTLIEMSQVRLTRVEDDRLHYAPVKDDGKELFEAHLGVAELNEDACTWTGIVTFRKVEFDSLSLTQSYLDIRDRELSLSLFGRDAEPAASNMRLFASDVPTTLFFWELPKPDDVRQRVKVQGDGWRRYAVNVYLDKKAEQSARLKALREEDKRRARAKARELKKLQEQKAEERKARERERSKERRAQRQRQGLDAGRYGLSGHRKRLEEIEEACRPKVIGEDTKGRPVLSHGYRREDGVWVCPPGGITIRDVMRPTVEIQGYRYDRSGNTQLPKFAQTRGRRRRRRIKG